MSLHGSINNHSNIELPVNEYAAIKCLSVLVVDEKFKGPISS